MVKNIAAPPGKRGNNLNAGDRTMRRISILLFCVIILFGCAGTRTKPAPEGNFVEVARLGISSTDSNDKVIVKLTQKDSPAELSGVKSGDIIVSIDGKMMPSTKAFISLMNNMRPGGHVLLTVNRNGQIINFEIAPKVVKLRPTLMKIQSLVFENTKVTVAVIVSEVKNSFPNVSADWADSIKNNLLSDHERMLLGFGKSENLSIVDRSRLKHILDEFKFSYSGLVSDQLRVKIGEMTGATHILDLSFARFRGRDYDQDDVLNARLVEIESGKVLAVDIIKSH